MHTQPDAPCTKLISGPSPYLRTHRERTANLKFMIGGL